MNKLEFKKSLRKLLIIEGLIKKPKKLSSLSSPYIPKNKGWIVEEWNGKKLKNRGKKNLHHYRINGVLYLVIKTDKGLVHEINDRVEYYTEKSSSCPMSSRMNKNTNFKQQMELDKEFLRNE
jgi:hypothetical protein